MKRTVGFVCLCILMACESPITHRMPQNKSPKKIAQGIGDEALLTKLKTAKANIGDLVQDKGSAENIAVFVKMAGSKKLLEIKNEQWPENTDSIEYTYNILYNTKGKIVMLLQSPFSQSGDWDITYKHYFDGEGKTFAFERFAGFFNSACSVEEDEAVHEIMTKYYSDNFSLLKEFNTLTDSKNRPLNKSKCISDYNYPYEIYADLQKCIKGYGLEDVVK